MEVEDVLDEYCSGIVGGSGYSSSFQIEKIVKIDLKVNQVQRAEN